MNLILSGLKKKKTSTVVSLCKKKVFTVAVVVVKRKFLVVFIIKRKYQRNSVLHEVYFSSPFRTDLNHFYLFVLTPLNTDDKMS